MLGVDDSPHALGLIPSCLAWVYPLLERRRRDTGARLSVRVSARELTGQGGLRDLLAAPSGESREARGEGPLEMRAATARDAAYFLDAAIAARTVSGEE